MAVSRIAKIKRPILTEIFPRKRLFEAMDRSRKRPVIWIAGPPGCGKTTLVSSYLDARKLPCLWYQVDPGDADPATFFYYLGLAAREAAPHRRKPLPFLTPEYQQGMSTFTLRFFEDLFARLKIPSAVVFDNYSNPQVDALIDQGQTTMDKKKRQKIYSEALKIIHEDVPFAWCYQQVDIYSVNERVNWKARPDERLVVFDMSSKK